ncbi:MCP four helix bundle domain-containing protein [Pseudomonas chlororaphis]|uniref:MCP four helix bundle domain-containing protein n=1 Tax=Pseudomonas chlororaphis TaxID=587753 RepID=UPI003978FB5E
MKNWTLRQRILASFAVIIAIMLLMVVVSYSRLLKIEAGENSMRDDAIPGVYFSSMIRSAWVDTYLQTQEIIGLKQNQDISSEDKADFKAFEERLQAQMNNYKQTLNSREDQTEFDAFEKDHQDFNRIQARCSTCIPSARKPRRFACSTSN